MPVMGLGFFCFLMNDLLLCTALTVEFSERDFTTKIHVLCKIRLGSIDKLLLRLRLKRSYWQF